VKCYACGKTWHMSWECPKNKDTGVKEARIFEAQQRNLETNMKAEAVEEGISLMMRKSLVNPEKEVQEPVQRNNLFRTTCKTIDRLCKVIIDSGSTDNLVSMEMVVKLKLEMTTHPSLYRVSWLQK
jgi:hypothetical protein